MMTVCEIDDYPRGNSEELFKVLDEAKSIDKNFKVTIFAIPYEITPESYEPILKRKDWVRLGIHGWKHELDESYFSNRRNGYTHAVRQIKKVLDLPYEFNKIFKPRSYGYSWPLIEALRLEEFVISLRSKYDLLHGHHLFHKWFPNLETDVKIKATILDNKDVNFWYGHTTEEENDYFPIFFNKKYKRKITNNNYNWRFSEEIAVWV